MNEHKTVPLTLPPAMRPTRAEIDERMAPLIRRLWQLGYVTTYCCQGDMDEDSAAHEAYIVFRSRIEAALFVALAGPMAWDRKTHGLRDRERPSGRDRWTWDWRLERDTVRFPSRDIGRALAALRLSASLAALIGAVSDAPVPLLCALAVCPRCAYEQIPATTAPPEAHRRAPRICPTCGGVVMARRKDARYCSRRCQLAARHRDREEG
jgi:ribosomal protein S27AE